MVNVNKACLEQEACRQTSGSWSCSRQSASPSQNSTSLPMGDNHSFQAWSLCYKTGGPAEPGATEPRTCDGVTGQPDSALHTA